MQIDTQEIRLLVRHPDDVVSFGIPHPKNGADAK
jgi:hypothetical protein